MMRSMQIKSLLPLMEGIFFHKAMGCSYRTSSVTEARETVGELEDIKKSVEGSVMAVLRTFFILGL